MIDLRVRCHRSSPPRQLLPLLGFGLFFLCFDTATPVRAQEVAPGTGKLRLQFPNNPVTDLLGIYELLTGKAVVKDSEIFDGVTISLVTAHEVTTGQAIKLIESALQSNGYVIVPEPDGAAVRVLTEEAPLAALSESLAVYHDPADLPEGRQLVSFFLKLDHLDPVEAAGVFYSHIGLNEYGRLTPVANPPGLLVTENSAMVRQILRLKQVLDVPQEMSRMVTLFYELEHADASVMAEIIQGTFDARDELPTLTNDTIGDKASRTPSRGDKSVRPRIIADDRLNRLMVVAQTIDHEYVSMIILEFDRPIITKEPFERALQYVFVDEILPVLVDVLQDTGTGTSVLPDGDTVRTRIAPQASTQASTLTGRTRSGIQRREDDASQVGGRRDILISPVENNAPISVLVGKTRLIADVQANAILAMGPPSDISKINKILDRLDRKPPQVYLSTIIGQLNLGDGIEYGVDYLSRLRETGSGAHAGALITSDGVGNPLGELIPSPPVPTPLPGVLPGLTVPPGLDPVSGLLFYGNYKDDIEVLVRALEETDRFKVLSRPAIFARNGKKAVIASGEQIPVPTSTLSRIVDSVSDSVTSEIEFKDVVLKLEVIPLINSNKEVSLTIAQINDNVIDRQLIDGNLIPVIATEQLTTSVTVPNRSTIVLGGLITETESERTSGLPVVSRIPYLGNLFKSTKKERNRRELLVFIQPTVVDSNDEIRGASLNEDLRTDIGGDAFDAFPPPKHPVAPVPPPTPRPAGR